MEELTSGVAHLLRPVLDSEHKDASFRNLLVSCADQRVFTKVGSGISPVVSLINTKLNESSSRFDGLALLLTYLPQCSLDVLSENACSWMQFCLKSFSVPKTSEIAFNVFKILLEQSVLVPELSKYVSSCVVAGLAEQLHQGIPPQAYTSAMQCLEQCMRSYNGPCGPHRKVFEKLLFSLVDSTGPERYKAARCVALLPQLGGGGVGGIQYENAWVAQHHTIIHTIHLLLDELYANINELTLVANRLDDVDPLPLAPIEDSDPILLIQKLKDRLTNVATYLMFMFILPYPVPKEVSASCVMDLICRGLAVTGASLGNSKTTHSFALLANLPLIHTAFLKVLEALIIFGKTNMLLFASLICKLAIQSLKWTSVDDWPFGSDQPFRILRKQSYLILKTWCGIATSGSMVDEVAQQLVELSKRDIYAEKETVSLSQTSKFNKKQNNQRAPKRKGNSSMLNGSTTSKDLLPTNKSANKDVCVAALQAMQVVIMSASYQLQPAVHKVLHETVVSLLLKVTNNVEDAPIPYSEAAPRFELYKLLLQLVLDPHPNFPPPTSVALKLFSSGLRDREREISIFCGTAQSALDKIIHPAYASLNIVPNYNEMEETETARSHQLNSTRAALRDNADDNDHEITDAVSMSSNIPGNNAFKPKHRSTILLTDTPFKSVSRSPVQSTPNVAKISPKKSRSPVKINDEPSLNVLVDKERKKTVDLSPSPSPSKGKSSVNQENDVTKTVDLTMSDKSDDDDDDDDADISELPCEIDLADDSDDDKSNLSICSQTTVSTPQTENISQLSKADAKKVPEGDAVGSPTLTEPPAKQLLAKPTEEAEVANMYDQSTQLVEQNVSTIDETTVKKVVIQDSVGEVSEDPPVSLSEKTPEGGATDKKRNAEEGEESSVKKAKLCDEFELDSGEEESLLLSFQDVTREEVEDGE